MPSRVLVVYATTEGQTARIAQALADTMRARGSAVDVCEAGSSAPAPDGYDGVIVAASVHAGSYQEPVRAWAQKHHRRLQDTPSAFVSVCLAVMQHDEKTRRDLDRIHDNFVRATGWRPGIVKEVAGALPYTRYGWLKRLIMKRIVGKAGGDTDTSRDYEYTDWDDVRRFAGEFADLTARPRRGQPS